MKRTLSTLMLYLVALAVVCGDDVPCQSPQYLERGKTGIVECHFPEGYYGVLWYNTTDYLDSEPIAYVKNSNERGGTGYETNEYLIAPNGSLVINKVSLQDDRNFTAVVLESPRDEYSPNNIHVIVTVKPYQMQPHIDGCNPEEQFCVKMMEGPSELSCRVEDSRPSIDLNWYAKTYAMDRLLTSNKTKTLDDNLYTTVARTAYNPTLNENMVFVCRSVNHPVLLQNEYSLVLLQQNMLKRSERVEPTTVYAQYSMNIELTCTDQPALYLLWRKIGPDNRSEDLIYTVFMDNSSFTNVFSNNYEIANERSLFKGEADVTDEGLYTCTVGDGMSESVNKMRLKIYITPDPGSLTVEGCDNEGHCSLTVPKTGELTCSLKGIRPVVDLRWEIVEDHQRSVIKLSNETLKKEGNGLTYDITLKSHYEIQESFSGWISIRCKALNVSDIPFDSSRKIYLLKSKEESQEGVKPTKEVVNGNESKNLAFLSLLAIFPGAVAAIAIYIVMTRTIPYSRTDEEMPMIDRRQPTEEQVQLFKEELKTTYKKTWERFRPLPYTDVSYPINEIFIEGEIEQLQHVVSGRLGKFLIWQKLDSHNEFLDALRQRQVEIILEGEPGFGKTTLGYQFAFDWDTNNQQSPLKDIAIYILLRLRYLKDASSIPAAIRKFLLPGHSSLTIEDVSNILYHSQSVVIFLDGYNRFPNDERRELKLMQDIRTSNICRTCHVIVSTKPFCLPENLGKDVIRMRLTGFGEASWRKYLKKSVVGNDSVEEERIIKMINDNVLIRDLCQIPLFFVLFSHITKKYGSFGGNLHTVTNFFQTVIDHFESEVLTEDMNGHSALSSVCFELLCNKEKGLIWNKKEICRKLGQTLYNEYLRIGLIVEREFCRYMESSGRQKNGRVQYETKVRFCHDVFCEWFAARKLAQVFRIANQEECRKYIAQINPLDHQYVYRFACGFDVGATKEIVKHIRNLNNGDTFAILCILEQPEKFTDVKDTISNICSSPTVITSHDTLFLQRSTVQVLQFASERQINIECLWLGRTNSIFDASKESLELSSGIFLPKLSTLRQLSVHDPDRKLSKDDVRGFLQYASLSKGLKDLRFQACLLPFSPLEDVDDCAKNDMKTIDVQWEIPVHERYWYTLDMTTGEWRHINDVMSKEKYDQVVQSFAVALNNGGNGDDLCDVPGTSTSSV